MSWLRGSSDLVCEGSLLSLCTRTPVALDAFKRCMVVQAHDGISMLDPLDLCFTHFKAGRKIRFTTKHRQPSVRIVFHAIKFLAESENACQRGRVKLKLPYADSCLSRWSMSLGNHATSRVPPKKRRKGEEEECDNNFPAATHKSRRTMMRCETIYKAAAIASGGAHVLDFASRSRSISSLTPGEKGHGPSNVIGGLRRSSATLVPK